MMELSVNQAFKRIEDMGFKISFDTTLPMDKGNFIVEPERESPPVVGSEEAALICDNIYHILIKATFVRRIKLWILDDKEVESIYSYIV